MVLLTCLDDAVARSFEEVGGTDPEVGTDRRGVEAEPRGRIRNRMRRTLCLMWMKVLARSPRLLL